MSVKTTEHKQSCCVLSLSISSLSRHLLRYKVSDFAHTVLDRMSADPLFDVATLNPKLVGKVGKLRKCLQMRARGAGMGKYLANCRLAQT